MDIATIIGLVGGTGLIIAAIMMGGSLGGFVDMPSVLIVVGGTFMVTFIMFPLKTVLQSFKIGMKAFFGKAHDPASYIPQLVTLAEKARKESLVALEKVQIEDPFLKKGVQLIADGTEEGLVRSVLENDITAMKNRHRRGREVFKGMGTMAPAFGMIGTLIGLVRMLQNLDDPSSIGPAMAVALLTTFYGALIANLVCLPLAKKLEERSIDEAQFLEVLTEGVISLLNGDHPSILKDKLMSYVPPSQREKD